MTKQEIREHCNDYGYSDEEVGAFNDGYKQGRADQLEEDKGKKWELMLIELGRKQGRADFIAEHTQINAYGKPFILISSEEYEQLKEQSND